jgi:hypothetical protein
MVAAAVPGDAAAVSLNPGLAFPGKALAGKSTDGIKFISDKSDRAADAMTLMAARAGMHRIPLSMRQVHDRRWLILQLFSLISRAGGLQYNSGPFILPGQAAAGFGSDSVIHRLRISRVSA